MVDKLYHRANPRSSFRLTVRLVVEIQRFVCDRATPPIKPTKQCLTCLDPSNNAQKLDI